MNIAVLASGNGTNFEAIARSVEEGKLKNANIKILIGDRKDAFVYKRAKRYGVKTLFINSKSFKNRVLFDKEAVKILRKEKIELVVLAGFMRI